MNYYNVYNTFLQYFKTTTPKERILKRNKNDVRLSQDSIYVELHHIVPKSLGGTDHADNLVRLLPEEHIFIHFLRWKVFKKSEDLFATNMMINGFFNKANLSDITLTKVKRMNFRLAREAFSILIRKKNKGHPGISAARKGKMPVKHYITGEAIGSVPVDHENIKSGIWVHITKGRKASVQEKQAVQDRVRGIMNPNSIGLTDLQYIQQTAEYIKTCKNGRFTIVEYQKYCNENGFKFIKHFSTSRFGGSRTRFIRELRDYCDKHKIVMKFDQYYRGKD